MLEINIVPITNHEKQQFNLNRLIAIDTQSLKSIGGLFRIVIGGYSLEVFKTWKISDEHIKNIETLGIP